MQIDIDDFTAKAVVEMANSSYTATRCLFPHKPEDVALAAQYVAGRLADAEEEIEQWEENPDPDDVIWQRGFDDGVENILESEEFLKKARIMVQYAMDNIADSHDVENMSGERVYRLIANTLQNVFIQD